MPTSDMLLHIKQHLHLLTHRRCITFRLFSNTQSPMKTLVHAAQGFILATILVGGGLFAWALLFLDRHDSYWDRQAGSADTFFLCWLAAGTAGAGIAACLSRTRR